jgi:hypothetical protein
MRCFFNLVSDYQTVPDEHGMELANLGSAILSAYQAIGELN